MFNEYNRKNITVHLEVPRYYSPEGTFTISIKLWIQNFIVLNVLFQNSFRNQAQFFNLFAFFVTLRSPSDETIACK